QAAVPVLRGRIFRVRNNFVDSRPRARHKARARRGVAMAAVRALLRSFLPSALVSVLALSVGAGCTSESTSESNPDPDPQEQTPTRPEGVKLCYTDLSESHAATKAFLAALGAGDKAARAQVVEQLDAAVK